jgi:hypothetical protein
VIARERSIGIHAVEHAQVRAALQLPATDHPGSDGVRADEDAVPSGSPDMHPKMVPISVVPRSVCPQPAAEELSGEKPPGFSPEKLRGG